MSVDIRAALVNFDLISPQKQLFVWGTYFEGQKEHNMTYVKIIGSFLFYG